MDNLLLNFGCRTGICANNDPFNIDLIDLCNRTGLIEIFPKTYIFIINEYGNIIDIYFNKNSDFIGDIEEYKNTIIFTTKNETDFDLFMIINKTNNLTTPIKVFYFKNFCF